MQAVLDSLAIGALVGLPAAVVAFTTDYLTTSDLRRSILVAVASLAGGLVVGSPLGGRLAAGRAKAAVTAALVQGTRQASR